MEGLQKQIRENYERAFFDLLKEKVASDPPDYEWLVRLYTEIRDKLCKLLKPNNRTRLDMEEKLDPDFFNQLIRNKVFDGGSMYGLVWFVFEKCLELGSPGRDEATKKARDEVMMLMKNNGTFAEIVPLFIKNANTCIDAIYDDINELKKHCLPHANTA